MSETVEQVFRFCPRCGTEASTTGANPFRCTGCDYIHFFGPCAAVGGIICDPEGRILFLRRQRDPGMGKLGIPGGFVDQGESLEDALRREALEEVNLTVVRTEYLTSVRNSYDFRGVVLPVTDVFFRCDVESFDSISAEQSEVSAWLFCHPDEATLNDIAFESNRKAVQEFLRRRDDQPAGGVVRTD